MADYIRRGTCGACKEFEFEGNDKKGYCRRYRSYYWDTDSCSRYDEDEQRLSSGGGCFLTTACCQHKGLPDDCYELTTLRSFRDTYLLKTEEGQKLVEEYYRIAPSIVDDILASANKEDILESIYNEICKIIVLVEAKRFAQAIEAYRAMVVNVQKTVE